MAEEYYNKPEYEGFETDYRILDALEVLTDTSMIDDDGNTNEKSKSYIWWTNGGDEQKIISYLNENYPDWKDVAPLYWGDGGIKADETTY